MLKISIIFPCLNEEKTIDRCIKEAKLAILQTGQAGEIIVADNNSTDRSQAIASAHNDVRVIEVKTAGYGRACYAGLKEANGDILVLADADGTYDLSAIPLMLKSINEKGSDLVIGNRFAGKIEKGAMPFLHRNFGTPILSWMLRLLFGTKIVDAHCGLRAITKNSLGELPLKTLGMEFASEMIILAGMKGLKIDQVPTNYQRRSGVSKLNTWRDGWRHLRFMLMYAPNYLFLFPGIFSLILGLFLAVVFKNNIAYGSLFFLLGFQIICLGIFTKIYMQSVGFIKRDRLVNWLAQKLKFETGIHIGLVLLCFGLILKNQQVFNFVQDILQIRSFNLIIIMLTILVLGVQIIFSSFFISMMTVEKKSTDKDYLD